jgi:hypothetical protein
MDVCLGTRRCGVCQGEGQSVWMCYLPLAVGYILVGLQKTDQGDIEYSDDFVAFLILLLILILSARVALRLRLRLSHINI